jgi:hypothetical protein
MTRRLIFFLTLALLLAACVRPASQSPDTTPVPNVPTPRNTPTEAPISGACRPADLKTSSNASDSNAATVIGVTLVNVTGYTCLLTGQPQIALLGADGKPIPAQYSAAQIEQTPPAPDTIKVIPGESAIVSLIWRNACGLAADEKIGLRLTLAGGETLEIKPQAIPIPQCDDSSGPATVTVAPYSYPP